MGYKKYAKDYEIEYRDRVGKKRPEAVRVYVGPYFKFIASEEKIAKLKKLYLILAAVAAVMIFVPLFANCGITRVWYVQIPAVAALIPWLLAACSVWRLWTVKEKAEREHYDMMYQRLNGSALFMIILGAVSFIAGVVYTTKSGAVADLYIGVCYLLFTVCGVLMFANRKGLVMEETENPEKPKAKK